MAGELGNETNIDLLGSSTITMSTPNFALIGNDDFVTNLVLKKIGAFRLRRDLVEIESNYRTCHNFSHTLFFSLIFFRTRSHVSGSVPPDFKSKFSVFRKI